MNPEKLLNDCDERVVIGQTNLYIDRENRQITINHAGNNEDTEHTLRKRVDKMLGKGTWDMLHNEAKSVKTTGYIPRLYTEILQF